MMEDELTIGRISALSGISVDTIRFYERKGLIKPPQRNASGYRVYPHEVVDQMRFIKRSRDLRFSLQEVSELFNFIFEGDGQSKEVQKRIEKKILEINEHLEELTTIREQLEQLLKICKNDSTFESATLLDHFLKYS